LEPPEIIGELDEPERARERAREGDDPFLSGPLLDPAVLHHSVGDADQTRINAADLPNVWDLSRETLLNARSSTEPEVSREEMDLINAGLTLAVAGSMEGSLQVREKLLKMWNPNIVLLGKHEKSLQTIVGDMVTAPFTRFGPSVERAQEMTRSRGTFVAGLLGFPMFLSEYTGLSVPIEAVSRRNLPDGRRLTDDEHGQRLGETVNMGTNVLLTLGLVKAAGFGKGAPAATRRAPTRVTNWVEAEKYVSQRIGVPRNIGPGRVTVPGTGRGGFRIPDFNPELTWPNIVEVKSTTVIGKRITMTPQIRDYITGAQDMGGVLKIHTNMLPPTSGDLLRAMREGKVALTPF